MSENTLVPTANSTETAMKASPPSYYSTKKIRKSMWHYLLGRGMSAIGSFAVAILLIRVLPVETYGIYTALAGLLVTLGLLSDGGLDRIIPKFLPMLRSAQAESQLAKFCWKLLFLRIVFIVALVIPVLFIPGLFNTLISNNTGLDILIPFAAYTILICVAVHLSRTLQALLLQREATQGMALEWFAKLTALLAILAYLNSLPLNIVVWIQALSVALGAFYMLLIVRNHLHKSARKIDSEPRTLDISPRRILLFGWHNYLPNLIGLVLSSSTMKLISAYYLGNAQTAALGFAYAITGVMRNYLPATLMLGLIEPVFMARYAEHRDFKALNEMSSVILKINLFILAPATVWLALSGAPIIDFITAGKYTDTVWLLTGMMVTIMWYCHYLVLRLIVNAVEESWLLFTSNAWASLVGILQIGAMIFYGLPGMLAGSLVVSWFENYYLVRALRRKGHPYKPDWKGLLRIIVLALLASLIGSLSFKWQSGIFGSLLAGFITVVVYLGLAYYWKPFSEGERQLLNRFVGRKLFIW